MKKSESSQNTLKNEQLQTPLPGFKVEVESHNPNWRKFVENTLKGRVRIHMERKR